MEIAVDIKLCQGHALCAAMAPALIHLDDDGRAVGSDGEVPAELRDAARRAEQACPEQAIRLL